MYNNIIIGLKLLKKTPFHVKSFMIILSCKRHYTIRFQNNKPCQSLLPGRK